MARKSLPTRSTTNSRRAPISRSAKRFGKRRKIGPALKPNLVTLRDLRNGVAKEMKYPDYFSLQVAAYGMTTDEMLKMLDDWMATLRPLYLQLHTWAKYKLAEKFHQPVPKKIPAHWISNRWAQEWPGLVEAANIDKYFKAESRNGSSRRQNNFTLGSGSRLCRKVSGKNRICIRFRLIRNERKIPTPRATMSIFRTTFVLYKASSRIRAGFSPRIMNSVMDITSRLTRGRKFRYLLRLGAAPGFHEGVGELISLASSQVPYFQSRGVLPHEFNADKTAFLLDDALARSVPFIYFSCGTMPHWEADIYARNLPPDQWNARWWKYVSEFQGIEPPSPRGEEFCDAATKTHINDTPAYYYNYAFATVFKFQLHDYIARKILHQPPQSCNYADNKEVGAWLNNILKKGGTEDWRKVLKEATGEDISTRAMMEYFKPLDGLARRTKQRPPDRLGITAVVNRSVPRLRGTAILIIQSGEAGSRC